MRYLCWGLVALAAMGCARNDKHALKTQERGVYVGQSAEHRLMHIGLPLLVAASRQSSDTLSTYGFTVKDGAKRGVVIDYVHPDFPITAQEIEPGDRILSINGRPITRLDADDVSRLIWKLGLDGKQTLDAAVVRNGSILIVELEARTATRHRMEVTETPGIDVSSDSDMISVSRDTLDYLENDHQVAMLMAHAIAHDIMGHRRRRTASMGARMLVPDRTGRLPTYAELKERSEGVTGFTLEQEQQADKIALNLLHRAGFSRVLGLKVYEKLAAAPKAGIEVPLLAKHPLTPDRVEGAREAVR